MISREKSAKLYQESLGYFPGGVNSPVRAFKSVGGTPLFIEKGDGAYIWDADGQQYLDFCCSWGPLILGHNHPEIREKVIAALHDGTSFGAPTRKENELASLIIKNNPFVEKIRFVSSGTEAVMSAVRVARGYTGRNKILKFEGCYHGHVDYLLVKAGSGLVTFGETSSAGVPESFASETLVVSLHDEAAVKQAFEDHGHDIAAILIEPIPANNGLLLQDRDFLLFLREITKSYGSLLIFDEVISGFRVHFNGAAGYYDIAPDMVCYGKIIGGGLPVGCYGASAAIMSKVSPDGPVYQAGTLSGNPVAMSAGIAQLTVLLKPGFYSELEAKTHRFVHRLQAFLDRYSLPMNVYHVGSIFWLNFSQRPVVRTAAEIDPESMRIFRKAFAEMLNRGIYFGPSGYEVGFVSAAHSEAMLEEAAVHIGEALRIAHLE